MSTYDLYNDPDEGALAIKSFGKTASWADPVPALGDESPIDAEPAGSSAATSASDGRKKKKTAGQLRWEEAIQETQAFNQDVLRGALNTTADEAASAMSQAMKMILQDELPPLIAVRPQEELLRPGAFSKACQANSEALALSIVRCTGFVEVNVIDRKGRTALMWAASRGFAPVCAELMNRSDLNLETLNKRDRSDLWSALHHAAARGHDKVVLLLLENSHFTVANKDDARGHTAFHLAARNGHTAVCRVLLTHPGYTKVNELDPRGWSALHFAAMNNQFEVCKVLLYYRDFNVCQIKDIYGHTALDYAEQKGYQKLCSYLFDHPRCFTGDSDPDEVKARAVRRHLKLEEAKQEGLKLPQRRLAKEQQVGPKALQKLELKLPQGKELASQPKWYNQREWSPRLHRLGLSSRQEDQADPPPLVACRPGSLAFADDSDELTADSDESESLAL